MNAMPTNGRGANLSNYLCGVFQFMTGRIFSLSLSPDLCFIHIFLLYQIDSHFDSPIYNEIH